MSSDIVKGSRVVRDFNTFTRRLVTGEVITDVVQDPLNQGLKAYVKWDTSPFAPYEVYLSTLITEDKAKEKNTQLEVEFTKLQEEVSAKLDDATKALHQANELARGSKYSVNQLVDDYHSFFDEISSAGWSTSSWSC